MVRAQASVNGTILEGCGKVLQTSPGPLIYACYAYNGVRNCIEPVMIFGLRLAPRLNLPHHLANRTSVFTRYNITSRRAMTTENKSTSAQPASENATNEEQPSGQQPLPLPEPPADSKAVELDVSTGNAVKLDHLGPMVVNRDGTLSRIANWENMAEIERKNTLRILGKRNQLRLESLKAAEDAEAKSSGA